MLGLVILPFIYHVHCFCVAMIISNLYILIAFLIKVVFAVSANN